VQLLIKKKADVKLIYLLELRIGMNKSQLVGLFAINKERSNKINSPTARSSII
jgi:hypothetical protein